MSLILNVICSDGQHMKLNKDQYSNFIYFVNNMEDLKDKKPVTIPYESRFLDFCIKFYETPEEYRLSCMSSIDFKDMKVILSLANYLDSENLLDCVTETIAKDIKNMDIHDMANYFGKTIDEDNEIYKELSWFKPKKFYFQNMQKS